jgi:hypothetical protein
LTFLGHATGWKWKERKKDRKTAVDTKENVWEL